MKAVNLLHKLGPDEVKSFSAANSQLKPMRRFPAKLSVFLSLLVLGALPAGAQPYSIWNDSTVPALQDSGDPNGVEVGLRFRSAVDGFVTGIRFYKGAGNTGTHIGNVWTSTGTLLGSVTFGPETPSGWQQQALPVPVPINSNTTYVVSYYAPVGHYSADTGYFAASGVDSPPLRALADGEDGANGIYAYSPVSTFPNQTYNSANYWVDVVMEPAGTGCAGDVTPPTLTVPPDVILTCSDCNTDPQNTGMATATDECSVTVTNSDVVCGACPKVVKRTWTATDGAGNASSGVQTITCLPPSLVTDSSGCIFDRDPSTPEQDFRLIYVQDPQNWPCYRIAASNPGQFFYNVFCSGTPGQQITLNITLPYPFVTQGANPIHGYDWVSVICDGTQQRLAPGNAFFVSSQQVTLADYGSTPAASTTVPVTVTVPASGFVQLAIHLDYGLKRWTGYTPNASDDAVNCADGATVLIPNHGSYEFSVSGAQSGATTIENINAFKRIPGVGGLVERAGTLDPLPGTVAVLANAMHVPVGLGITDEDGFYLIAYKHTGKAATYYVSITTPPPDDQTQTQTTTLKANAFAEVDFQVP